MPTITPNTGEHFTADQVRDHVRAVEYTDDFGTSCYVTSPRRYDACVSCYNATVAVEAIDELVATGHTEFRVVTQWKKTMITITQEKLDAWILGFRESLVKFGTTE